MPLLRVNDNIITQLFLILCLGLTLFAFAMGQYYILLLPLLIGLFFILVFVPESIPYILIISNFYGGFVFSTYRLAVNVTDVFLLIVILGYFGIIFTNSHERTMHLKDTKILNFLVLLFVSSLLSLFINISNLNTKFVIISIWYLIKLVQLPLIFFVFSRCRFSNEQTERFINVCFALSFLQLPVVVYQYYSFYGYGISRMRNLIHGTFTSHHSMLGTFMLIPLSFCIYRFLKEKTMGNKIWYIAMGVVFLFIIIMSGSRSALFGVFVSSVIFLFMHFRFNKKHILYIIFVLAAFPALFYYTPLEEVIISTFHPKKIQDLDLSSISRLLIWLESIKHFFSVGVIKKLFGIGIGAYPTIQHTLVILHGSKTVSGAHNNFLHVLSEIGIVGLCIYILLFFYILRELYKNFTNPLSKAYFFATLALLASSVTQETFWFQKSFGSLWLFYMFFLVIILQNNHRME